MQQQRHEYKQYVGYYRARNASTVILGLGQPRHTMFRVNSAHFHKK